MSSQQTGEPSGHISATRLRFVTVSDKAVSQMTNCPHPKMQRMFQPNGAGSSKRTTTKRTKSKFKLTHYQKESGRQEEK
jgi:hypothetical protein